MRVLAYPNEACEAVLCDYYGNAKAHFELTTGENSLPINTGKEYYKTAQGEVFRIYAGEGVLEYAHAKLDLTLEGIDIDKLEYILCHRKRTTNKAIKSFIKAYDLNIQKGTDYITPRGFKRVDSALTFGQ